MRASWKAAFALGETDCEKLGATHLLWHGIFAFKAGRRATTDLVAGESVTADEAGRIASGLVLTEWKRVTSPSDLSKAVTAAEKQSTDYAGGLLGGIELRSLRYVVVVSAQKLIIPDDTPGPNWVYRHINIACYPQSPSAAAKARDAK